MSLSRELIVAAKVRADAATEGPWFYADSESYGGLVWFAETTHDPSDPSGQTPMQVQSIVGSGMNRTDAEFIAAAREDVPALVARVRELEGAVEQVRAYASIDRLPEPYRANVLRALEGATEAPDPAPEVPGFEGTLDALDGLTIRKGDD